MGRFGLDLTLRWIEAVALIPAKVVAIVWSRLMWRCEYWIAHDGSAAAVLCHERSIVATRVVGSIDEVLDTAATWADALALTDGTDSATALLAAVRERTVERRRPRRGGRRINDAEADSAAA